MLIEIHMIQNHSPSNLNRDDLGAPKTCIFGGVTRARISSQCLKRSIRRSAAFQAALEKDGGIRTRSLIAEIARRVHSGPKPPDKLLKLISESFQKGGVKIDATKGDPTSTNILFFIPDSGVTKMATEAKQEYEKASPKAEDLAKALAVILAEAASVPDIALSGRMTELDAQGPFEKLDFTVEAAMQVSHAISTHAVVNEVDYWTAADDRPSGQGAAHVNEAMFNSACFYKYFCLDWGQLVKNLGGSAPDRKDEAERLAACTLGHFIRGTALTTPSGKQNSYAAQNLPDGILVEIKKETKIPTSYANAFADPVDAACARGLVGQSIAQLGQYMHDVADGFGISADRFWFSFGGRYPLTWVDRNAKETEKEKQVTPDQDVKSLDELVAKVVKAATQREWNTVKDAGRKEPQA